MTDFRYQGAYASFLPADLAAGELLQGADFVVGDPLDVEFRVEAGETVAWLKNRWGGYAGKLDAEVSRTLSIARAREMELRAVLSFVAFTDAPEPGYYWGQAALVCFDPGLRQVFEPWLESLQAKLAEGARVDVNLGPAEVDRIIESGGTWLPSARVDLPKPEQGKTVVLKSHRTASEGLIELGRQRRPGCMVVGWTFNVLFALGVIALVLHLCGVF
ncbi:MAG: hypothetical protein IKD70_04275 [Eggerthellaceae bacterium]|nr:hypothetical protein [Eggerthellaceae bacterium]